MTFVVIHGVIKKLGKTGVFCNYRVIQLEKIVGRTVAGSFDVWK